MTELQNIKGGEHIAKLKADIHRAKEGSKFLDLFRSLRRMIVVFALLATAYWSLIASDRYVSEANVIIRKTDSVSVPSIDISMLVSGVGGVNRTEQLHLREYLLSVDILKELDAQLDLRSHYSDSKNDIVSRLWFKDASMEWFHRHYLSRVDFVYDDVASVLRINAQAYEAQTAQAISKLLVQEGERYMNQLGHELIEVQVRFLSNQVKLAQVRFQKASQALLSYQNRKGLLSPQATAESINTIISGLETQRTEYETRLASLPKSLDQNHPNIVMFRQSLEAIDRQIDQEKAKLTSTSGKTLNITVEEFHRLKMEVNFTQDLYKSALTALEKGRIDAARMLQKVSVLQAPTLPEYPIEPRRIYNIIVTLLLTAMLAGLLKLLEGIVRDHVD